MKNLFNSGVLLSCIFLLSGISYAQQLENSKEDEYLVRKELRDGMISFTYSVGSYYQKGMSYEELLESLIGEKATAQMPKEGKALLQTAHKYLSEGLDAEQIAEVTTGKEMAAAALFVHNYNVKHDQSLGDQALFGIVSSSPYEEIYQKAKKCRWWQLSCHLKEIFGEEGGTRVLTTLIDILIIILNG